MILESCFTPVPIGTLDRYIRAVNQYPLLPVEEELLLARHFREQADIQASRCLILSNLKFVVRIARRFSGYGLGQADLIQEGNIGLIKAVHRYQPDFKVRLMAFAAHWIKAEIYEYVIRNFRMVKVATTKTRRKLFFNLRKIRQKLEPHEHLKEKLALTLKIPEKEIPDMEGHLIGRDLSLELSSSESDGSAQSMGMLQQQQLALLDKRSNFSSHLEEKQWQAYLFGKLKKALFQLDPRSAAILSARFLSDPRQTLQTLADFHGVSVERVRQIEVKALAQLKREMLQARAHGARLSEALRLPAPVKCLTAPGH